MEIPHIYKDKEIKLQPILNKKVGIIGYGNQGRAHALNLYDSGVSVKVGLRSNSKNKPNVLNDKLEIESIENVVKWADIISILVPDQVMADCFNNYIVDNLTSGQTLLFAHGYNIHYKMIIPQDNVNIVISAFVI